MIVQTYGGVEDRQVMIRVPQVGAESGGQLSQTAEVVVAALKQAEPRQVRRGRHRDRGAGGGARTDAEGHLATVLSLVGILAYIALRFQFSFAVGAIVATIHDLLVTFAFLAFFRYDLSLNVIAAILTITGYSTNDTIVIFDRVRENLRSMRRDSLDEVVNQSVNQTLGRTVITAGTALLSAICAVPVRRRSAARLRLHDDRRHHHRHVFQRVHRRGHRDVLEAPDSGCACGAQPPSGAAGRRPSTPEITQGARILIARRPVPGLAPDVTARRLTVQP